MHLNSLAHAGQAGLEQGAKTAPSAPSPRLVRAAQEFEGQMMKELLQPLTASDPLTGEADSGDADFSSGAGSGGALSEFASEALGQALSEHGGFGIANQIVRELSRSGNRSAAGKVTGSEHVNTVMRKFQ
jgi:Rod binding domain-containing protein